MIANVILTHTNAIGNGEVDSSILSGSTSHTVEILLRFFWIKIH